MTLDDVIQELDEIDNQANSGIQTTEYVEEPSVELHEPAAKISNDSLDFNSYKEGSGGSGGYA